MAKFKYEVKIEAPTENEADHKMQSVTTLLAKLTGKELGKLAFIVKEDPKMLAVAKEFLKV
jgi:hypothetical protein